MRHTTRTHMHVCVCACVYACTCACVLCVCACTCACARVHAGVHVYGRPAAGLQPACDRKHFFYQRAGVETWKFLLEKNLSEDFPRMKLFPLKPFFSGARQLCGKYFYQKVRSWNWKFLLKTIRETISFSKEENSLNSANDFISKHAVHNMHIICQ